jgi:hypothetical protein
LNAFDIALSLLWPVIPVCHGLDGVLAETTGLLSDVRITDDWLAGREQSPRNASAVQIRVNGVAWSFQPSMVLGAVR